MKDWTRSVVLIGLALVVSSFLWSLWSFDLFWAENIPSQDLFARIEVCGDGRIGAGEEAADPDGNSCSATKPVEVVKPNPIWIEVNPGG